MPSATLHKLGGSVVLTVPRKVLNLIDLDAGSRVDLRVEAGRLIVAPEKRKRYTLKELLALTKPGALRPRQADRAWLEDTPAGEELL